MRKPRESTKITHKKRKKNKIKIFVSLVMRLKEPQASIFKIRTKLIKYSKQ